MTASGIRFDMNAMVAAHPSYPFARCASPTLRIAGGHCPIVDRGPTRELQADGLIMTCRAAEQALVHRAVVRGSGWRCWLGAAPRCRDSDTPGTALEIAAL